MVFDREPKRWRPSIEGGFDGLADEQQVRVAQNLFNYYLLIQDPAAALGLWNRYDVTQLSDDPVLDLELDRIRNHDDWENHDFFHVLF